MCGGLGAIGLNALAGNYAGPRMPGKAKHVIFLFLPGGPSHVDMFDPKPALAKFAGQRPGTVDLRTERQTGGLLPSPFQFSKYGKAGIDVSELCPKIGSVIDDICVVRSMYTFNPTHTPARSLIHSGSILATRPSMGAWVSYGLGTENQNLPPMSYELMSQAAEAPLADCSIGIKHHVPTCLLVDTNCEHIVATGKFSNSHFSVTRSEIVGL